MGSNLTIKPPPDYRLTRDVCSYGYFLLAPNRWDASRKTLARPLHLSDGIATMHIAQDGGKGGPLRIGADRALSRPEQGEAKRQITRMLRLDDETVRDFHSADPRWKRSGRGRLFRSPTLFEDIIKTVTSCNVSWPNTMGMNRRLCEVISPAFPTPAQLARRRPATLRARCRVGYRDQRIVDLAKLTIAGEIDEAWLTDQRVSDDDVFAFLKTLPGIGPYAAANIMQLLGRYSMVAIDSESVRHGRVVLGMEGEPRQIEKRVAAHYEKFGEHRFRSYWFEIWDYYERVVGPADTWEAETSGTTFTASTLNAAEREGLGVRERKRRIRASAGRE